MSDFVDLVRDEFERGQMIEKSARGQVVRPPEHFVEHPFAQTVLNGVRQRLARQQRPTPRGVKKLDRKPTFVDLIYGTAAGVDVVQKGPHDDWTGSDDLDATLAEFLEFLDST